MAETTTGMGRAAAGGLEVTEVTVPVPDLGPDQVKVTVDTAAVNPADLKVLRGELAGWMLHRRTRQLDAGGFVGKVVVTGVGAAS